MTQINSWWFRAFGGTLVVWLLYLLLSWAFHNFNLEAFSPIAHAIEDIRFTDFLMKNDDRLKSRDERITIINCNGSRADIAHILDTIDGFNPKVIGLDYVFNDKKAAPEDTVGTDSLCNSINKVIHPLVFTRGKENAYSHSFLPSIKCLEDSKIASHVEVLEEGSHSTIRYFTPVVNKLDAFSVAIVSQCALGKVQILKRRGNKPEIINFINNKTGDRYQILDGGQLNDYSDLKAEIENKIVLIGMDARNNHVNYQPLGDIFYTPLNQTFIGRSKPDMYGVEIHAQIISMILDENYLSEVSKIWIYIFAVAVVFITMVLLFKLVEKDWLHHGLVIACKLVFGLIALLISYLLLQCFRVYFEISLILVLLSFSLEGFIFWELAHHFIKKRLKKK